jgi:predicted dehydrogenase
MLSLCIATDDPLNADWRGIGARLRGAAIEACTEMRGGNAPPEECQAVAFIGSRPPEKDAMERVLGAGKHALLATEPCLTGSELTALSDAARKSGVQFGFVNPDRYLPSRQLIRQQLESRVGDVGLVRLHRWEPAAEGNTPWGFPGPLVRDLEMALWLTGRTPNIVCALESPGRAKTGVGRVVQIHLGFAAGMALIDFAGLPAGDGYHSLSVIGANGAAYADDHQNAQLLYRAGPGQAVRTGEGIRHLTAMLQDFADAIAGGRNLSPTVSAWRNVFDVAGAARQSLATNAAVAVSSPSQEEA